ncbi:MAG: hypothetical protein IT200_12215 [Thermoleophilia bacterium]|nr:hypothetical protein [Thermoleophilia bacterium]
MSTIDQAWRRLEAANPIDPERLPEPNAASLDGYKSAPLTTGARPRRARTGLRPAVGVGAMILAIGGVLVFSLPRGSDAPPGVPPTTVTPSIFPTVSALSAPAAARDRLDAGGGIPAGVDAASARRAAFTSSFGFFISRGAPGDSYCVMSALPGGPLRVAPAAGSRAVNTSCAPADSLGNQGVLAAARAVGATRHIGGLVPDGIASVRIGSQTVQVEDNAFAIVWSGGAVPTEITLVGAGAPLVGREHPPKPMSRGTVDGLPSVTVPFAPSLTIPGNDTSGAGGPTALRGHRIGPVAVIPSGVRLTRSRTGLPLSNDLAFRVHVLNGGDFVEAGIVVTVALTYPNGPTLNQRRTITRTRPGVPVAVTIPAPIPARRWFGKAGAVRITIAPVRGEQNVANNAATFPVVLLAG